MNKAETYFLRPDMILNDLEDAETNPTKYFLPIENKEEVDKFIPKDEFVYPGAILLQVSGIRIMSFKHWDLIDMLWPHLLILAENVLGNGEGTISFFEKPVAIHAKRISNNRLRYSYRDSSLNETYQEWEVPLHEFVNCVLTGAKSFYNTMFSYGFTQCIDDEASIKAKIARIHSKVILYAARNDEDGG